MDKGKKRETQLWNYFFENNTMSPALGYKFEGNIIIVYIFLRPLNSKAKLFQFLEPLSILTV